MVRLRAKVQILLTALSHHISVGLVAFQCHPSNIKKIIVSTNQKRKPTIQNNFASFHKVFNSLIFISYLILNFNSQDRIRTYKIYTQ